MEICQLCQQQVKNVQTNNNKADFASEDIQTKIFFTMSYRSLLEISFDVISKENMF